MWEELTNHTVVFFVAFIKIQFFKKGCGRRRAAGNQVKNKASHNDCSIRAQTCPDQIFGSSERHRAQKTLLRMRMTLGR